MLSLQVVTHNNAGIAARSALVANFGAEMALNYAGATDMEEPDAKRFRGLLDSYFSNILTDAEKNTQAAGAGGKSSPACGGDSLLPAQVSNSVTQRLCRSARCQF